jgi:hypothetical protein
LPAEVPLLIHPSYLGEPGDSGGGDLLDGFFLSGSVQFCQDLVALNLGLLLRDGTLAPAGCNLVVSPKDLYRAVRLNDVLVAAEDPWPPGTILPRLHLRMLHTSLHT